VNRRTLAGDLRVARAAIHYALAATWHHYKGALVPIANATIVVALIALLGALGYGYLFR